MGLLVACWHMNIYEIGIMYLKSVMNLKSNSLLTNSVCSVTDQSHQSHFYRCLNVTSKTVLFMCAKIQGSNQGYIVL